MQRLRNIPCALSGFWENSTKNASLACLANRKETVNYFINFYLERFVRVRLVGTVNFDSIKYVGKQMTMT